MTSSFEPFRDRLSRDIRNGLSTAFRHAVAALSPEPFRRAAAGYLAECTGNPYRAYITERQQRYETALARLLEEPDAPLRRAAILWDLQLFFEVHELLEQAWLEAEGDEKLLLQAMIRAAGVYIKLEYGYQEAAAKMAARALPVLTAQQAALSSFFDPTRLLQALSNPSLPAPRLLD